MTMRASSDHVFCLPIGGPRTARFLVLLVFYISSAEFREPVRTTGPNWLSQSGPNWLFPEELGSAASPDYVKFQTVIKSAASAASLRGGRARGRLNHSYFFGIR